MPKHAVLALMALLLATGCASGQDLAAQSDPERSATMPARMLKAHNAWRGKTGVPPLQWSKALQEYARDWARTLQRRGCRPEHRDAGRYGENIAWASGTRLTAERVVAMWGEEEQYYDYAANRCAQGEVCGHYTQVIWEDTRSVGCSVARCTNSEVWVCNYDPPGNWVGEKPY